MKWETRCELLPQRCRDRRSTVEDLQRAPLQGSQPQTAGNGVDVAVHKSGFGLSPLDLAFRLQFQNVIYLDVTVTYG
jgi:hypothetical protein